MKNNSATLKSSRLGKTADILIWIFLIGAAVLILIPLLFMFTASVMPATDIFKMPYPWITRHFQWQNYWNALKGPEGNFMYLRNILNSLIVASAVTIATVLMAALTGYGLAKFPFKGRSVVFLLIMSTMMIPFEAIMIPMYMVVVNMNLQDWYAGLI